MSNPSKVLSQKWSSSTSQVRLRPRLGKTIAWVASLRPPHQNNSYKTLQRNPSSHRPPAHRLIRKPTRERESLHECRIRKKLPLQWITQALRRHKRALQPPPSRATRRSSRRKYANSGSFMGRASILMLARSLTDPTNWSRGPISPGTIKRSSASDSTKSNTALMGLGVNSYTTNPPQRKLIRPRSRWK